MKAIVIPYGQTETSPAITMTGMEESDEHRFRSVGRVLGGIGSFVDRKGCVDPAGADGIDPNLTAKADSQRMCERSDAAFCGGIAFALGLTHAVTGGGNIDNACSRCKMGRKQLGKIKRRGNAYTQSIFKILIAAVFDATHLRCGIVDQIVHVTVIVNNLFPFSYSSLDARTSFINTFPRL